MALPDLADMPWAACQPGTGHHQMHLRVCRQFGGFEPDLRHTSDDFLILLELARTTGSATLLPELILAHEAPRRRGSTAGRGTVERLVYVLTRKSSTPTV